MKNNGHSLLSLSFYRLLMISLSMAVEDEPQAAAEMMIEWAARR
jgi:hypothetical protein